MILNKGDTCFQFQYDICISMESVIVQLHFHQLWSLCDLWFKIILNKIHQGTKNTLLYLLFKFVYTPGHRRILDSSKQSLYVLQFLKFSYNKFLNYHFRKRHH